MKNSILFTHFVPPHGATKTVEVPMSHTERKAIGKKKLVEFVYKCFTKGESVTIKSHGVYYTLTRDLTRPGFLAKSNKKPTPEFHVYIDYLPKFDPTALLRIVKLLRKNTRDKKSLKPNQTLPSNVIVHHWGNTLA